MLARFDFRRGGLFTVNLAGHALLHMEQVESRVVQFGHGDAVAEGKPVEHGMVEREEDAAVDRGIARADPCRVG